MTSAALNPPSRPAERVWAEAERIRACGDCYASKT